MSQEPNPLWELHIFRNCRKSSRPFGEAVAHWCDPTYRLLGWFLCCLHSSPAPYKEQLEVLQRGAVLEEVPSHPDLPLIREQKAKAGDLSCQLC